MILNPAGHAVSSRPYERTKAVENLALNIAVHKVVNSSAYFSRYNHRKFLLDSGLIDRWRKEGHATA